MIDQSQPKRLLLITYAFPPIQAAESFLCIKTLAKVKAFSIDILTIDPTQLGVDYDNSLNDYVNENFGQVYRASPPLWINKKVFKIMRVIFFFPDRFRFFNNSMFKKALDINVENYDAIISWSQWHSVHLMAAKIKSRFPSLPWVVHMSDPWSNNPFLKKIIGYPISQYFLERRVIKNADAISFTTNEARFLVMKKYPSSWINKTYVTPHSYDTRFYKKAPQYLDNAKFTISYLGNFYGPRNPSLFAQAVSAICKEQEDFFDGVTIKFIGKWIGHENWDPKDYGIPDGIIKIEPPVPYLKSLEEMNNSNLLLILDAPFKKSVFFPSKLVDYIGSGRPIFAITPEGSCSDILLKVGGIIASPESEKSIADGLRLAVQKLKDNTVKSPAKEMCKQYSNDNVGYQFAVLFDQVIKG